MLYIITVQNDLTNEILTKTCECWYYTNIIEEIEKFLEELNEKHCCDGTYEVVSIVRIGEVKQK